MTSSSASTVDEMALLSWAAYRQDGDATAGENDLSTSLVGSGWAIVHPSQLGVPTLDPDNEYFEVHVGGNSGPVAAAFLVQRNGVLAIAFRGSDESGDQLATINNQSGYFDAYRNFLDAALLYAADPANGVTQILVTGHSLGGVMAEWFANEYTVEVSALELPVSIATFGSPGTNISTPPTALAQGIIHFGHTGDQIFEHQGFVGGFLSGLVREGTSIEVDLPNVDANDARLNFFEHDMFLYQRSAPALASSYFGQRLLDDPTGHRVIVDTIISVADDQITLDFSNRTVPLAIIGDSGITAPGFADIDIIWGGSAGDWIDGGTGNDTLFGGGGNDELFGGPGADLLTGGLSFDRFIFDNLALTDARAATPLVDYINDYDRGNSGAYMAAEGDQIDLSPLLAAAYGSGQAVGALVRIVEDGDSTAARLQVDVDGTANGVHWTTIGRLDDIHLGDTVNVILNSSQPAGTTLTLQGNFGLTGDFNGDGNSDVLWRNDSGQVAVWFMNGSQIVSGPGVQGAGPDWHIVGTGDFNNDNMSDVLWRNDSGQVAVWLMNGSQVLSGPGVQGAGPDWHVSGTGDFNGDGNSDVLWRNDSGQVAIWFMNGSQVLSGPGVQGAGPDWHIVGTGDFNGDSRDDILWRNDSGQVAMWLMNGAQIQSGPGVQGAGLDWHIEGIGDFNGDSRSDILWRNDSGANAIWFMNGAQVSSGPGIQGAGPDWHIVGTGDFNNDHMSDILWRNDAGLVAMWQMNGAQIVAGPGVQGAGIDWQVAAHHYDFV